jgi:monoamine oxidase
LSWQRASEIDPLSENDRIQSVLNRWETVFPGVKGHVSLGTSFSWNQQEWTGGAYAWPSPAQDARLSSSLGKAEGRIHFAGEHASENHGWMQGALSSGLRAAREMHVYAQAS